MSELFTEIAAADIPQLASTGVRIVRVPRGLRSKEKLLGVYAERLEFPDYFGWNWDALEECLRDLSWLPPEQSVAVVHEDLPFSEGPNRQTYLDILRSWRDHLQQTEGREIRLLMLR